MSVSCDRLSCDPWTRACIRPLTATSTTRCRQQRRPGSAWSWGSSAAEGGASASGGLRVGVGVGDSRLPPHPKPPAYHSPAVPQSRSPAANVTVMAPRVALNLLLLSPVMHWAVLIKTNAWYGCEEGIQTLTTEVFAHRKLCDAYMYASRGSGAFVHTPEVIHITSGSPTTPTC